MNTTVAFNYNDIKKYGHDLFNSSSAYQFEKKTEALILLFGIDTGLRVSDLLNLKYSDIELDQYFKPSLSVEVKKTKKRQTLYISTSTHRLIEVYRNWVLNEFGYREDLIFFNYKNNKPFSRQWVHSRINKANNKGYLGNKVRIAGAHSLRRTAAVNVYKRTEDLRISQHLLGHSKLSMTERYLKIDEEKANKKLSACFD